MSVSNPLDDETREQLRRTVKVSWDAGGGSSGYSADRLRAIFSQHGSIQDVVVKDKKAKKDGGGQKGGRWVWGSV